MIIDIALYQNGIRVEGTKDLSDLHTLAKKKKGFLWLGLYEPDYQELNHIASELELHPLAIEDAVKANQRPKLETYDNITFFVIKTVFYNKAHTSITTGEVQAFIGENFIVTIRHGEGSPLSNLRTTIEKDKNHLSKGPLTVLHAIIDKVIDDSIIVTSQLEKDISELEKSIFTSKYTRHSESIYKFKREIIEFRQALEPLKIPLQELSAETNKLTKKDLKPYFRDTLDHLIRTCEIAETLDSILTVSFQAELSNLQVEQNNDVRRISAWVALAAMPTMVAGIYGMNFKYMPELNSKYGYPVVLLIIILGSLSLYYKFKKSKWL